MNGLAAAIREAVPMAQAAEYYGLEANRSGFALCPFHREDTPSLKLYPQGFYCFGCGKGGDVIRFVMELFGITFSQAVTRLSSDFHLGLLDGRPARPSSARLEQRRREREEKALREAQRQALWNRFYRLDRFLAVSGGRAWEGSGGVLGRLLGEREQAYYLAVMADDERREGPGTDGIHP